MRCPIELPSVGSHPYQQDPRHVPYTAAFFHVPSVCSISRVMDLRLQLVYSSCQQDRKTLCSITDGCWDGDKKSAVLGQEAAWDICELAKVSATMFPITHRSPSKSPAASSG